MVSNLDRKPTYLNRSLRHLYHAYSYVHQFFFLSSWILRTLILYISHHPSRFVLILVQSERYALYLKDCHNPTLYTPLQCLANPNNQGTQFPTDLYNKPPLYQHRNYYHPPASRVLETRYRMIYCIYIMHSDRRQTTTNFKSQKQINKENYQMKKKDFQWMKEVHSHLYSFKYYTYTNWPMNSIMTIS